MGTYIRSNIVKVSPPRPVLHHQTPNQLSTHWHEWALNLYLKSNRFTRVLLEFNALIACYFLSFDVITNAAGGKCCFDAENLFEECLHDDNESLNWLQSINDIKQRATKTSPHIFFPPKIFFTILNSFFLSWFQCYDSNHHRFERLACFRSARIHIVPYSMTSQKSKGNI